jgi:hypothetical protein
MRTSSSGSSRKLTFTNIHLAEQRLSTWQMYRPSELATVSAGLVSACKGDSVPTTTSVLGGGENAGALRGVSYETLLYLAYAGSTEKSLGLSLNMVESSSGYVMAPGEVRRIR